MMSRISDPRLFSQILRISCFFIFLGRAWQHLLWDAPFRAFFWDQTLLEGVVTTFSNLTWFEYVTGLKTEAFITGLTRGMGGFYLLMAVLTLVFSERMKKVAWLYYLSSFFLAVLALLYCKEKFYHVGQFFEYSIQFATPVLFAWTVLNKVAQEKVLLYMKWAIALTFVAHGMYAAGHYPRPGVFLDMTISILGVSEGVAHQFLLIAGILDVVLGIGIFLPRYSRYFLLYAVLWGLATALARTWANVDFGPGMWASLNQYLFQTIYRLSNGLIPLAAFVLAQSMNLTQREATVE